MIKFVKDEFDTKILRRNVFKLFLEEEIGNEKEVLNLLDSNDIETIFCFTIFSQRNLFLLNKLGFILISIRNTYRLASDYSKWSTTADGFEIIQGSKKLAQLSQNNIRNMAYIIGSTSRYFKDKLIPQEKSLEIYINWINNSIYNRYANESFFIIKNNKLIGLVTSKIKDKNGFIDLIGVHSDFQGFGLGKALLRKGVQYLLENNVDNIFVITEAENIPANIFYQKNNFVVDKIELVYHKHL